MMGSSKRFGYVDGDVCAESWALGGLGSRGGRGGRGRPKKRRNKYRDLGVLEQATWGDASSHNAGTFKLLWNAALVSALQGQHRRDRPQGQIRQSLPVRLNSAACCPAKDRHQRRPLSRLLLTSTFTFNVRRPVRTELQMANWTATKP